MSPDTVSSDQTTSQSHETTLNNTPAGFNARLREYIGRLSAAVARDTERLEMQTPQTDVDGNEQRKTDRPFIRVTVTYGIENDTNPVLATIELIPNIDSSTDEEVFFGYSVRVGLSSKNLNKTPVKTLWYDNIDWDELGVGNPHIRAFNGSEHSNTDTFDYGFKSDTPMTFNDAIDVLANITTELREYRDSCGKRD